jgi:hypothetical protein
LPLRALAQSCDAYYPFDGNIADASGNGYDGTMIGKEGLPALAQFSNGIDGQALALDGRSAMRAYLDLSPDLCPQVTVTAWVRVESNDATTTQYLLSTGNSSGPGLRSSGVIAVLSGLGNGLSHRFAIRDGRAWFFVAGVWDNVAETYRFHWRDRVVESSLAGPRRPPEDAFWVGAFNDNLDYAIKGAFVDELRITGKALSVEEVNRMRGNRPGAVVMLEGAGGGATAVANTGTPQSVSDIVDGFGTTRPTIDPDSLPDRPQDLLASGLGTTDDSGPLLEVPEGVGTANSGVRDPDLSLPDDLPQGPTGPLASPPTTGGPLLEVPDEVLDANAGLTDPELVPLGPDPVQEFQDDLAMAQESALEDLQRQRINEFENRFGLKERTQVVIGAGKDIAYAAIPTKLLVGPEGAPVDLPDLGVDIGNTSDVNVTPGPALPGTSDASDNIAEQFASRNNIREIIRFQGSNGYMVIRASGEYVVVGDPGGLQNFLRNRIQTVLRSGRPIDLVANNGDGYLLVSGTNVHSRNVPQSAVDWAEEELSKLRQITAFTFMPGDAWIGVSIGGVQAGGMNRTHFGFDVLTDVRRLVADGEQIHDISVTSQSDTIGSWAIATDQQIYFRQEPTGRFPSCRAYQRSNDEVKPRQKTDHELGEEIGDELGRNWSCWYPKPNCLANYPTWSETDMSSPSDPNTWQVNLLVTLGIRDYSGIEKEIVDCWLDDQLQKAENVFRHSPSLKFRLQVQHRTTVAGVDIVNYTQESQGDHNRFMDRNFDVMAKSKTEGYYPIFVPEHPCVGYRDNGQRKCDFSQATFNHFVDPFTRKHGIMLLAERKRTEVLAHEFGHYLSLKHTFEPYINLDDDLNCNKSFTPKGGDVTCNSCMGSTNSNQTTCTGPYNVMDYCSGEVDDADLNFCQQSRANSQKQRYMTNDGQTKYTKMKGRLGEPYCTADSHCLDDEYCNTGVLTVGRNVCKSRLSSGAICSRGGQCESGKCPFLSCQ